MNSVLVIDNEKSISDLLMQALKMSGYSVKTALSGREGVRMFETGSFDLVITDISMPDIDGQSVARHIRNSLHKPFTPIIAMSGTPWLLQGDEFDSVFSKPFSLYTLLDTVNELTLTPS